MNQIWLALNCGVQQRSVLGPLLFIFFINNLDLDCEIVRDNSKFADGTKIGRLIISDSEDGVWQEALNGQWRWSKKGMMQLNTDKCSDYTVFRLSIFKKDLCVRLGSVWSSTQKSVEPPSNRQEPRK